MTTKERWIIKNICSNVLKEACLRSWTVNRVCSWQEFGVYKQVIQSTLDKKIRHLQEKRKGPESTFRLSPIGIANLQEDPSRNFSNVLASNDHTHPRADNSNCSTNPFGKVPLAPVDHGSNPATAVLDIHFQQLSSMSYCHIAPWHCWQLAFLSDCEAIFTTPSSANSTWTLWLGKHWWMFSKIASSYI